MAARVQGSWFRLLLPMVFTVLLFMMFISTTLAGKRASEKTLARESFVPSPPPAVKMAAVGATRAARALEFQAVTGLTYLETRSFRAPTIKDYSARISTLLGLVASHQLTWTSTAELDQVAAEVLGTMFFAEHRPDEGSRMIAALMFFVSKVSRLKAGGLPRATRALRGWEVCHPNLQRLPLPLEVLGGVKGFCRHHNLQRMALRLWICFRACLRPGEGEDLIVESLVAPVASSHSAQTFLALLLHPLVLCRPGKTGNYDETVLLDVEPWCCALLAELVTNRAPEEHLWRHPCAQFSAMFRQALCYLGLGFMETSKVPAAALAL